MKILHLLISGDIGGIEMLMKNYASASCHNNTFMFLWRGGQIADEMKSQGIQTVVLNKTKKDVFGVIKSVFDFCKREKVDAVVSHHSAPFLKFILICVKVALPNIATFAYIHSNAAITCNTAKKRGLGIRKFIHRTAINKSDGTVAISQSVKKSIVDLLKIKNEKITVIYNGAKLCDECDITIDNQYNRRLVYVGRVVKEKGIQNTIKALSLLNDVDFEFNIIGNGDYQSELTQMVDLYKLNDKVNFVNGRSDVARWIKNSNIFLHIPDCEEGFGMTVVEAMSAKCLCVCNKRGALPEIVKDNINGYLVENDDVQGLAEKIKQLLLVTDDEEKLLIRNNARETSLRYSMGIYTKELDNFFEEHKIRK